MSNLLKGIVIRHIVHKLSHRVSSVPFSSRDVLNGSWQTIASDMGLDVTHHHPAFDCLCNILQLLS